jgi:phage repressor protein C with HTH and peptisase S24 domain
MAAIGISRGGRRDQRSPAQSQNQRATAPEAADWTETEEESAVATGATQPVATRTTEDAEDTEMTASGTAPPVTS